LLLCGLAALEWLGIVGVSRRITGLRGDRDLQSEELRPLFEAAIRPLLREV